MKLRITHAVRLRRRDVARLTDLHRQQLFLMVEPARARAGEDFEVVLDAIEDGEEDGGDHGVVYVRLEDADEPSRAFEGWFLDWGRWPMTEAKPDTGEFFVAGTTTSTGVRMAQHGIDALPSNPLGPPLVEAVTTLRVASKGAATKANPPFAHAALPKPEKKQKGPKAKPLHLEVVSARRWTEPEIRKAPPESRFQVLHSLRPKFATKTHEGMEGTFALGLLYAFFDPGPSAGWPAYFVPNVRWGLASFRFRDRDDARNEFEAWLCDTSLSEASYWPSKTLTVDLGRVFVAGGVTWTGVSLEEGKVTVDAKKALPIAEALAGGLRALGRTFDVEVPLVADSPGYFGSKHHAMHAPAK